MHGWWARMTEFFNQVFSPSNIRAARSTALHPLTWALGIMMSALSGLVFASAPFWLLVCQSIATGFVLAIYIFAYLYLLFRNTDALRSEHFILSKMAIERGLVGDSHQGLFANEDEGARAPKLVTKSEEKE
jgi:hypothetical protein